LTYLRRKASLPLTREERERRKRARHLGHVVACTRGTGKWTSGSLGGRGVGESASKEVSTIPGGGRRLNAQQKKKGCCAEGKSPCCFEIAASEGKGLLKARKGKRLTFARMFEERERKR